MSYGASDEVAEDFKVALEDLTMNSRYEISNLTIIAKENTENALAISEALKDHIKRTGPSKKLPALYLLDSIVKNVGTPYTLFFGRQLFSTFMEAYALVDNNVRRKMEEMLKTWKEPVPGSIDTRPVFLPEVTRPIENALIKARTSAIQAHQEYSRQQQPLAGKNRPSPVPFRNTATTPLQHPNMGGNQYPGSQYPPPYGAQQQQQPAQYQPPPAATQPWQPQPVQSRGYGVLDDNIDTLNSDIARLITAAKSEFAQNPYDGSIQTRLKALLDLQSIVGSQKLPPDQIALIKDQVKALSAASKPRAPPPQPAPAPVQTPVAVSQPPAQQPSLASLLGGQNALAALLARSTSTPHATPPPPPANVQPAHSQPSYTPPAYPPAQARPPSAMPNPTSLLDQLRAAGLLPSDPAPTGTPPIRQMPQIPPPGAFRGIFPPPPVLHGQPGQLPAWAGGPQAAVDIVQLTPASLKIPRPHLIGRLYERLGIPCTQCGRRFQTDEDGKRKKAAHMDWHFRVHQRMVEAEKRGQHRSWYVDELDWIKSRETDEEHLASATTDRDAPASQRPKKQQYLAVPDDPELANSLCPICQEKFEMKWLDEEFVWMDAVKVGDRIYHASCHAEARKSYRGTPEPVLGKRKNEEELLSVRTKIKTEP
ncbi:hypothetical protein VC83_00943 [Pseudogymnoascus destructans]|uniref:CID domain-containing protein n=2 Tax=Pseudogymnoascus destructans TaxID=655981 RepID=L8FLA4_PSED2|nr:uncharacterized protein VC83_00943 [Pseudogymnoascus destructans]ELR01712.1 hypothetical protein GMDG_00088 [Pseudogymnoascus destructans 20631-21]OAF62548.1 hypothetical protein VC83_00943 [Pseudogymnoascus destructans]